MAHVDRLALGGRTTNTNVLPVLRQRPGDWIHLGIWQIQNPGRRPSGGESPGGKFPRGSGAISRGVDCLSEAQLFPSMFANPGIGQFPALVSKEWAPLPSSRDIETAGFESLVTLRPRHHA